jgi:hypothetical protein
MEGISLLPWTMETDGHKFWIDDSAGLSVADLYHTGSRTIYISRKYNDEANAAYIVHACNLYPELVEALEVAVREFDVYWPMRTADVHKHDCECLRCRIDALRAILSKCKAGAE